MVKVIVLVEFITSMLKFVMLDYVIPVNGLQWGMFIKAIPQMLYGRLWIGHMSIKVQSDIKSPIWRIHKVLL